MKDELERIRDKAKRRGVQFMDVRLFEEDSTTILVQDSKADKVSQGKSLAVGLRVLVDDAWGFASTDVDDYAYHSSSECEGSWSRIAKRKSWSYERLDFFRTLKPGPTTL